MSQPLLLAVIVTIGVATFLLRFSVIGTAAEEPRSGADPIWRRALRYVPVAVLSALVAPALTYQGKSLALTLSNPRLIAGSVALLVAWRSRNVLATLGVGMALLWLLQGIG